MSDPHFDAWEPVIGLEVHLQLNTKTKLFSPSANHFGDEPNTNIGPIDLGLPGTLPVLNREAVRKAVQLGLALKSEISRESTFDRKSYFYPDAPRNFQITQFFHPILRGGTLTCLIGGERRHFSIHEAHLEDDAGKLNHFSTFAGVDYNRAGVALLEIVSKPMMHSPKEASAFAQGLRSIAQFLDISTGNMEEGAMRMDVNISVRKKGEEGLRPRVEIKNMNSFTNMEAAIEYEIRRQITAYTQGISIDPGTYKFNLETGKTKLMRTKEQALDYRYFHEPDLPPIRLTQQQLDEEQKHLPELPLDRVHRYTHDLSLASDVSAILISEKRTSDFFEEALTHCKTPSLLANWITSEFAGRLKEKGLTLVQSGLTAANVGKLISLLESKTITGRIAKQVADDMVDDPSKDPQAIVDANPDYKPMADTSLIEPIVDQVLAANAQSIEDYKTGRKKAFAFLVGQVMKETKGKASPELVNTLLKKKIGDTD